MQAHLCPAMDPFLAQPHITRPLPPASSAFQVCPDQTPMLLSTQLTLLLQPFIDLPLPSPPIPPMFRKQLQVRREQASLPSAPISLSSSSPHLLNNPLLWLCGGPFSPLSVYTYWPLCPRAREQCTRTQKEDGRRDLPLPPVPPGGAHALCLPTALSGCTWPFMSLPTPRSCECRKVPQPSMFCPRFLHLLCLLPGMFPQRISGLFPRESVVSPTTAAPLLFLQSTHHGLIVHVLYSFSISPFYMVQNNVCFLDLWCTSREWHLSKPLLIEWMKVWILNYLYPLYHGMCLLLTQPL